MTNSGAGAGNSSARRSPALELIVISMFGLGVAFGYALGSWLL